MEEITTDLIVGQELSHEELTGMFDEDQITEYGKENIGEQFIVCKSPDHSEYVWSWILVSASFRDYQYRLIYKYTGS